MCLLTCRQSGKVKIASREKETAGKNPRTYNVLVALLDVVRETLMERVHVKLPTSNQSRDHRRGRTIILWSIQAFISLGTSRPAELELDFHTIGDGRN